jgi:hypothetical protein
LTRLHRAEFPERTELAYGPCHPGPGRARDPCAGTSDLAGGSAIWNWHPKPFKLLNRPRLAYPDRDLWHGSRQLDRGDLAGVDDLRPRPGLFQRRIAKRFDLRLTVVGDRLFTVSIHFQDDPL